MIVDRNSRIYIVIFLNKYPLEADSLNTIWHNFLIEKGFHGKTIVRLSVTDLLEHETKTYSDRSDYIAKSDSLVSYYLGCRCEIEATGYILYSWWTAFTTKDKVLLCLIILGCFLLFFLEEFIVRVYHRFFVRKVTVIEEKEVIVEKEIPVIAIEESQAHIYRLDENLLFDADLRTLKGG